MAEWRRVPTPPSYILASAKSNWHFFILCRYDLSINTQARYIWLKISKPFLLKKKCKSNDANDNANDDDMCLLLWWWWYVIEYVCHYRLAPLLCPGTVSNVLDGGDSTGACNIKIYHPVASKYVIMKYQHPSWLDMKRSVVVFFLKMVVGVTPNSSLLIEPVM